VTLFRAGETAPLIQCVGRRGVFDHNRRSAIGSATPATLFLASCAKSESTFSRSHVAVDPPGSTGTTSLRFGFSHLQKERKAPVEQAPQGSFSIGSLSRKLMLRRRFPHRP